MMQGGMSSEDETESSTALTPEGNMTLVDDIGEEEDKSSQQFITLVTKAGNTFYLIIGGVPSAVVERPARNRTGSGFPDYKNICRPRVAGKDIRSLMVELL